MRIVSVCALILVAGCTDAATKIDGQQARLMGKETSYVETDDGFKMEYNMYSFVPEGQTARDNCEAKAKIVAKQLGYAGIDKEGSAFIVDRDEMTGVHNCKAGVRGKGKVR
jgi:hypothetical protein